MLKGKNIHKSCKRFKKTGSIFQKTLQLPKTSLPLRRKNVAEFERDIQKVWLKVFYFQFIFLLPFRDYLQSKKKNYCFPLNFKR